MVQKVTCVACKRVYAFKPELTGPEATCKCGGRVQFADGTSPQDMPRGVEAAPAPAARVVVPVAEAAATKCIRCSEELTPGKSVCPYCGFDQVLRKVVTTKVKVKRVRPSNDAPAPSPYHFSIPLNALVKIAVGGLMVALAVGSLMMAHQEGQYRGPVFTRFGVIISGAGILLRGLGQLVTNGRID